MTISSALANTFKKELLEGKHDFLTATIKFVLIKSTHAGTYDKTQTNAGTPGTGTPSSSNVGTDAAAVTGDYTPVTGMTIAFDAPALFGDVAVTHPTSTISLASTNFNSGGAGIIGGIGFFNSSASNRWIGSLPFPGPVSTTDDTLEITWSNKDGTTGMIRIG